MARCLQSHLVVVQTTCSKCHAVEIAAAVTGIIVLVVGVLVGFLPGILVYHCISKHCSLSSKPGTSSHQQWQAGPVYEEVPAEKLELRKMGHMSQYRALN